MTITIDFARAFRRHVDCPCAQVDAGTVRGALDAYFALHPQVRSYVLDDQGAVRKHISVFVGGVQLRDRAFLGDALATNDTIQIFQALSGG